MKKALLKMQSKVCTDPQGRRKIIQVSRAAHTSTEIYALCEDQGLDLQDQKAKLTAALHVLYQAQEVYGPAAFYVEINSLGIHPRCIPCPGKPGTRLAWHYTKISTHLI